MNEDKFTEYYRDIRNVDVLNYNTAVFPTYVVQYYKGLHRWKEYQSFNNFRNPYLAKCRSYYNGNEQYITCKRYETLTDLRYDAPDNVNRALEKCIDLTWTYYPEREVERIQKDIIDSVDCIYLKDALLDVFLFSGDHRLLEYYDFSLDNILWDSELKNYILWDVVLT